MVKIFLLVLLVHTAKLEITCEGFERNNTNFSSELWMKDFNGKDGYRLLWVNKLVLNDLSRECIIQYLGEPVSSTPTSMKYIICEKNLEYRILSTVEYSVILREGKFFSDNVSLE